MKFYSPFNQGSTLLLNDIEDFKMPYEHYGDIDEQVMMAKYYRLHNRSKGCIVRMFDWVYGGRSTRG